MLISAQVTKDMLGRVKFSSLPAQLKLTHSIFHHQICLASIDINKSQGM